MKRLFLAATAAAMFAAAPVLAQTVDAAANADGICGAEDPASDVGAATGAQAATPTLAVAAVVDNGGAAFGAPPEVYPVCTSPTQDRCRVAGQATLTAQRRAARNAG